MGLQRFATLLSPLITLIAQRLLKIRIGKRKDAKEESEMPQEYPDSGENIDDKIYEYIMSKAGAIGIRSAAEDLHVPAEVIKEAIERMTVEGRLKA